MGLMRARQQIRRLARGVSRRRRRLVLCAVAVVSAGARSAAGQDAASPRDLAPARCDYRTCALLIAPAWNGLAVDRASGARVTNLNFFWPRDIRGALVGRDTGAPGTDSADAYARRALTLRRAGAVLTDAGALIGAVAILGALHSGRIRRQDGILLASGITALGLSIPVQFAADGALSQAVWWHNLRFVR